MEGDIVIGRNDDLLDELCENLLKVPSLAERHSNYLLERLEQIQKFIKFRTITRNMQKNYHQCPVCKHFTGDGPSRCYRRGILKGHLALFHRPNYQNVDKLPYLPSESPEQQYVKEVAQYYVKKNEQTSFYKFCDECREFFGRANFSRHVVSDSHKRAAKCWKEFRENKFIEQEVFLTDLMNIIVKYNLHRSVYNSLRPFLMKYTGRGMLCMSQLRKFHEAFIDKLPEKEKKYYLKRSRTRKNRPKQSGSSEDAEPTTNKKTRKRVNKKRLEESSEEYSSEDDGDDVESTEEEIDQENNQENPNIQTVIQNKNPIKRQLMPQTQICVIDSNYDDEPPPSKFFKAVDEHFENIQYVQGEPEDGDDEAPVYLSL